MTRKLKRSLAALLPLIALSACNEPMITDSDVIRYASEPAYTYDQGGRIFPTSCLTGRSSTYSGTPSSCQRGAGRRGRDLSSGRQAADPYRVVGRRSRPTLGRDRAGRADGPLWRLTDCLPARLPLNARRPDDDRPGVRFSVRGDCGVSWSAP